MGAGGALLGLVAAVLVGLVLHLFGYSAHPEVSHAGGEHRVSAASAPAAATTLVQSAADHHDGDCSDVVGVLTASVAPPTDVAACIWQPAAASVQAVPAASSEHHPTGVGPRRSPGVQRI